MAQSQTANGKTKARSEAEAIGGQIDTIKSDIAALTALVSEIASDRKDEMSAQLRNKLKDVKAQASDARDSAVDQASEAYKSAEDAVKRQPGMALGIAAGLGFLVGLMATSRRS